LNLTDEVDDDRLVKVWVNDCGEGRGKRWLYVNVDIRLKCSDDNGLASNVGRGTRIWGLVDNHPQFPDNCLIFRSESPESDPSEAGFVAYSKVEIGAVRSMDFITGVDIREWHNYTILWRPGNATFLIDEKVVWSTDQVPSTPLALVIHSENSRFASDGYFPVAPGMWISYLDLVENQSIEVDHIRVFISEEYHKEYSALIFQLVDSTSSLIEAVDARGLNTTAMRSDLVRFKEEWNTTGYVHGDTYMRIHAIMDSAPYLDELSVLFQEAAEAIASAIKAGEGIVDEFETLYHNAEEAWIRYEYERVGPLLEKIIHLHNQPPLRG
jgi:hypothetical protein